jgi:hypothetical protein
VTNSNIPHFRCQRLNAVSKEYEEVDVEVPSPIYETIKLYNKEQISSSSMEEEEEEAGSDVVVVKTKSSSSSKKSSLGLGLGLGLGGSMTLTSKIKSLFARN